MPITVRFFARVRELAERESFTLAIRSGTTIAELRNRLVNDYPSIAPILRHCAAAIDHEVATDRSPIPDGSEVAFLPPVSGGES